jgi:hypothetical protein
VAPRSRHISLLEKESVTRVTVPIYRDSMMGKMTLRSEGYFGAEGAGEVGAQRPFRSKLCRAPETGLGFFSLVTEFSS